MNDLCKRCNAECCRWINIPVQLTGNEDLAWMNARGEIVQDGKFTVWRIKTECKHLSPEGLCQIYDNRPESCKNFPVEGVGCNTIREFANNPTIRKGGNNV